jgi:hypothetical protein
MHYTLFGFLKMKLRGEERRGEERRGEKDIDMDADASGFLYEYTRKEGYR